jgi:hypothetical protein
MSDAIHEGLCVRYGCAGHRRGYSKLRTKPDDNFNLDQS